MIHQGIFLASILERNRPISHWECRLPELEHISKASGMVGMAKSNKG